MMLLSDYGKSPKTEPGIPRLCPQSAIDTLQDGGYPMLSWSVTFLLIALVAALLGFTGIAAGAASIAKILFFVFLVLFVISLIVPRFRGPPPV